MYTQRTPGACSVDLHPAGYPPETDTHLKSETLPDPRSTGTRRVFQVLAANKQNTRGNVAGTPGWLSRRILDSLIDSKKSGAPCGLRLDVKSAKALNVLYFYCSAHSTEVDKADTKREIASY